VFKFMMGEFAVCVFLVALLAVVMLILWGTGYLLKSFACLTYALLQQALVPLQGAIPVSTRRRLVFTGTKPVLLAELRP
jgi:hypothetical protein